MSETQKQQTFAYVDLFAGCGGFSLGLESVGGKLLFALERSPMAAETFMKNLVNPQISDALWRQHLEAPVYEQARAGLVVEDVTIAKKEAKIVDLLKTADLDLIVGGPPCQGFSLAGRRNSLDARNSLAWDYLDYVALAKPRIVVVENVLGMNAKFANQERDTTSAYSQVALALQQTEPGYVVQKLHLNSLHFGAAQNRERLFLVGVRSDISKQLGIEPNEEVWKSNFSDLVTDIPALAPLPTMKSTSRLTVQHAIGDLVEGGSLGDYAKKLKDSEFWGLQVSADLRNNNFRKHSSVTESKFEMYIALKKNGLDPLLMRVGLTAQLDFKRSEALREAEEKVLFPLMGTRGQVLASSFAEFNATLESLRTRKHSQRVLSLESTPPTVITSPDDYIHPVYPRVLSVRELARFQGFSDHFIFHSKETTGGLKRRLEVPQYSQVGNAVSPFVSRAIGVLVNDILARPRLH